MNFLFIKFIQVLLFNYQKFLEVKALYCIFIHLFILLWKALVLAELKDSFGIAGGLECTETPEERQPLYLYDPLDNNPGCSRPTRVLGGAGTHNPCVNAIKCVYRYQLQDMTRDTQAST